MSWTISRVEVSRPPGVSSRMIASSAPSSAASSSASSIQSAVAGLMLASSSIERAKPVSPCPSAPPASAPTPTAASATHSISRVECGLTARSWTRSPLRLATRLGGCHRPHQQGQPVDPLDHDPDAHIGRGLAVAHPRLPQGPLDPDLADRVESAAHLSLETDQLLPSRVDAVTVGLEDLRRDHEE